MSRDSVQVPLLAGTVCGVPGGHVGGETDSGASRGTHLLEEGETPLSLQSNSVSLVTPASQSMDNLWIETFCIQVL